MNPLTTDGDYVVTDTNGVHYVPEVLGRGYGNLPSSYIGDSALPGSRWLYLLDANGSDSIPSGHLDFQTHVDLTGLPAANAQIRDLQVSADNGFVSVAVNGAVVFSRDPGQTAEDFRSVLTLGDMCLGAFHDGLNTTYCIASLKSGVGQSGLPTTTRIVKTG